MTNLSKIFDIAICITIRTFLLAQICFVIYFLVDFFDQFAFLTLTVCFLIIIIDSLFVVIKRHGKEYKW